MLQDEVKLHQHGPEIVMSNSFAFQSAPTKLLVPIDSSSSFHVALVMAAKLASHFHAALYLLNVVPMLPINMGVDTTLKM